MHLRKCLFLLFNAGAIKRNVSLGPDLSMSVPFSLPALRCPGGERMTSRGIKNILKVASTGELSKLNDRFILNLKLTHQVMQNLKPYISSDVSSPTNRLQRGSSVDDKLIIEIGPGPGALTRSLLTRNVAGVLGIEVDKRFNPYLEHITRNCLYDNDRAVNLSKGPGSGATDGIRGKFEWVNGDVLEADEYSYIKTLFPAFLQRHERRWAARAESEKGSAGISEEKLKQYQDGDDDRFFNNRMVRKDRFSSVAGRPLSNERREELLKQRQHQPPMYLKAGIKPNQHENDTEAELTSPDTEWAAGDSPLVIVSNLPFSLSIPLLIRYVLDSQERNGIYRLGRVPLFCFLQAEVAARLVAVPGTKEYSTLSVLMQNYFRIKIMRHFSERTYFPQVEVLGALALLTPRIEPLVDVDPVTLLSFLTLAMRGRKKKKKASTMLQNCMPPEVVQYVLDELRIDGEAVTFDLLTTVQVARMAQLWKRFLDISNQRVPSPQSIKKSFEEMKKREREKASGSSSTQDGNDGCDKETDNEVCKKEAWGADEKGVSQNINVNNAYKPYGDMFTAENSGNDSVATEDEKNSDDVDDSLLGLYELMGRGDKPNAEEDDVNENDVVELAEEQFFARLRNRDFSDGALEELGRQEYLRRRGISSE